MSARRRPRPFVVRGRRGEAAGPGRRPREPTPWRWWQICPGIHRAAGTSCAAGGDAVARIRRAAQATTGVEGGARERAQRRGRSGRGDVKGRAADMVIAWWRQWWMVGNEGTG